MQKLDLDSPNYLIPKIYHTTGHIAISYSCDDDYSKNHYYLAVGYVIYLETHIDNTTKIILIDTFKDEQYEYIWDIRNRTSIPCEIKVSVDDNTIILCNVVNSKQLIFISIDLSTMKISLDQQQISIEYYYKNYKYRNNYPITTSIKTRVSLKNNQQYEIEKLLNDSGSYFNITDLQFNHTCSINCDKYIFSYIIETYGDMILLHSWNYVMIYRKNLHGNVKNARKIE